MHHLAENVFIVEGETVSFLSLPFSTRMTIVRLSNGALWVHSPIKLSAAIQKQLQQLGTVQYLVAPNHLHHLFLGEWQAAYPQAISYGTDEVIKKRQDLTFNYSLNEPLQWPWEEEIGQVLFTGSALMQECVFFHYSSKVLIVTDLVENFSASAFNYWQRGVAKMVGIVAPHGKMPLDWRLSFLFHKPQARKHINVILNWKPQILVMAHGEIVKQDTLVFLKRSFRWLL